LRPSKNHKVTDLENMEPAEARECTFSPEIHELAVLCAGPLSWWSSKDPVICNFPFRLASFSFADSSGLQDNIFYSLWHQTNSIWTTPRELKKKVMTIVLTFDLLMLAFFCFGDFGVCHSSLCLLVSGSYSKNQLSSPVMTWLKKIWFSFEPFKHFSRHFVSTHYLIVTHFFWNHLCTHFSYVQILCNNLVVHTFIKFVGDHSNCQMSILTNENPHTVDVCACSHRGGASRSWLIFYRFSPIYKVFMLPKYLSTWQGIIAKRFLNLSIVSVAPSFSMTPNLIA
jgi:hypothetical protein